MDGGFGDASSARCQTRFRARSACRDTQASVGSWRYRSTEASGRASRSCSDNRFQAGRSCRFDFFAWETRPHSGPAEFSAHAVDNESSCR